MTRARTLADLGSASLATDAELASHADDTTSVHGVADTAALATQSYADTAGGLVLLHSENISSPTYPINIDNVFSSDYLNYRVMVNLTTPSYTTLRFRSGGSTNISNSHRWILVSWSTAGAGPQVESNNTGSALKMTFSGANNSQLAVDIYNPFEASATHASWQGTANGSNENVVFGSGDVSTTTQYDGLEIDSSGNFSGRVVVYGYRQ
jgi:hypothetical protein